MVFPRCCREVVCMKEEETEWKPLEQAHLVSLTAPQKPLTWRGPTPRSRQATDLSEHPLPFSDFHFQGSITNHNHSSFLFETPRQPSGRLCTQLSCALHGTLSHIYSQFQQHRISTASASLHRALTVSAICRELSFDVKKKPDPGPLSPQEPNACMGMARNTDLAL